MYGIINRPQSSVCVCACARVCVCNDEPHFIRTHTQTLTTTHECIDTVNTIVAILSFSNKATSIGDASTLSCIVRLVVLGKRCRLTYI